MMKTTEIKTSELQGAALAYVVAVLEGDFAHNENFSTEENYFRFLEHYSALKYSTDWAQGGPIIDRERICTDPLLNGAWLAVSRLTERQGYGPTPLIAAMRCYVASKLGDTVQIPTELIETK